MGYDMYIAQPEMPVVQRVEDQPDPNYFRLNISGMARFLSLMDHLEILDTASVPLIDCPQEEASEAELEAWRSQTTAGEPFGIPLYKLSSNDAWLVQPSEIAATLRRYRAIEQPIATLIGAEELAYWNAWIDFLDRAAARGGFRVY